MQQDEKNIILEKIKEFDINICHFCKHNPCRLCSEHQFCDDEPRCNGIFDTPPCKTDLLECLYIDPLVKTIQRLETHGNEHYLRGF